MSVLNSRRFEPFLDASNEQRIYSDIEKQKLDVFLLKAYFRKPFLYFPSPALDAISYSIETVTGLSIYAIPMFFLASNTLLLSFRMNSLQVFRFATLVANPPFIFSLAFSTSNCALRLRYIASSLSPSSFCLFSLTNIDVPTTNLCWGPALYEEELTLLL